MDKVQKIREEVERIRNLHQMKYQQLDTDDKMCLVECGKRNLCNDLLYFIDSLQEEPVNEDLGEYINELSKQFPEVSFAKLSRIAVRVANWQKAQFEKNRLKHCNSITNEQAELEQGFIDQYIDKHQRMPTFLDAIEYGMRLQKEQIMKDVMPCVLEWYDGFVLNFTEEQLNDVVTKNNINIGDKVKLIVIKED